MSWSSVSARPGTAEAIARIPVRFLRTGRHPSASVVAGATTFDHVYEAATAIDDVYRAIVEALVAAAGQHGVVLYAVPGSPLVAERTVELLRADRRVGTGAGFSLSREMSHATRTRESAGSRRGSRTRSGR